MGINDIVLSMASIEIDFLQMRFLQLSNWKVVPS